MNGNSFTSARAKWKPTPRLLFTCMTQSQYYMFIGFSLRVWKRRLSTFKSYLQLLRDRQRNIHISMLDIEYLLVVYIAPSFFWHRRRCLEFECGSGSQFLQQCGASTFERVIGSVVGSEFLLWTFLSIHDVCLCVVSLWLQWFQRIEQCLLCALIILGVSGVAPFSWWPESRRTNHAPVVEKLGKLYYNNMESGV